MAQVIHGGFGAGDSDTADAMFVAPVLQTYSVAALNLSPEPGEIECNLLLAERAITEAKRAHPDLKWVVLPELFTAGYSHLTLVHRSAEDAQRGVSVRFFTSLACDLGLYIAYGFPERLPGAAGVAGVSDSANLVGPDGLVLTYRKRHLVRTTLEYDVFVPGTDLPVVEAGSVRVACIICWDLGFPEVARKAALAGADLILAPASWRAPWGPQYELSCAARALDNAIHLASANQIGVYPEAQFDTPGHIYGPDGLRLSAAEDERSVGKVDLNTSQEWRTLYGSTLIDDIESTPLEACL